MAGARRGSARALGLGNARSLRTIDEDCIPLKDSRRPAAQLRPSSFPATCGAEDDAGREDQTPSRSSDQATFREAMVAEETGFTRSKLLQKSAASNGGSNMAKLADRSIKLYSLHCKMRKCWSQCHYQLEHISRTPEMDEIRQLLKSDRFEQAKWADGTFSQEATRLATLVLRLNKSLRYDVTQRSLPLLLYSSQLDPPHPPSSANDNKKDQSDYLHVAIKPSLHSFYADIDLDALLLTSEARSGQSKEYETAFRRLYGISVQDYQHSPAFDCLHDALLARADASIELVLHRINDEERSHNNGHEESEMDELKEFVNYIDDTVTNIHNNMDSGKIHPPSSTSTSECELGPTLCARIVRLKTMCPGLCHRLATIRDCRGLCWDEEMEDACSSSWSEEEQVDCPEYDEEHSDR